MNTKKGILCFICTCLIMAMGTGCAKQETQSENTAPKTAISVTDAFDQEISFDTTPERVAALFGSYGDVWQLAGGTLVGITDDAQQSGRFPLDESVQVLGTVKEPNLEQVLALNPDLVLLSADIPAQVEGAQLLQEAGIQTLFVKIETLDDYLKVLKDFTTITNREDLYEANGLAVQAQVETVIASSKQEEGPKVLLLRAFSTGFKAKGKDNLAGYMLSDLGCENIADSNDSLLEELSMEVIIAQDPDYIFIVPMGADTDAAVNGVHQSMAENPAWAGLTAVKEGRVEVLSKDLYHYKPNDRWGEAYEKLAEILYS